MHSRYAISDILCFEIVRQHWLAGPFAGFLESLDPQTMAVHSQDQSPVLGNRRALPFGGGGVP